ncbi:hypothetical protein Tco_1508146 [Tanacetum coccineum]
MGSSPLWNTGTVVVLEIDILKPDITSKLGIASSQIIEYFFGLSLIFSIEARWWKTFHGFKGSFVPLLSIPAMYTHFAFQDSYISISNMGRRLSAWKNCFVTWQESSLRNFVC